MNRTVFAPLAIAAALTLTGCAANPPTTATPPTAPTPTPSKSAVPNPPEGETTAASRTCAELLEQRSNEETAAATAAERGVAFRVTARDGESFPSTMDYSENRINVEVIDDVVVRCTLG